MIGFFETTENSLDRSRKLRLASLRLRDGQVSTTTHGAVALIEYTTEYRWLMSNVVFSSLHPQHSQHQILPLTPDAFTGTFGVYLRCSLASRMCMVKYLNSTTTSASNSIELACYSRMPSRNQQGVPAALGGGNCSSLHFL